MRMQRAYYSDTLTNFLKKSKLEIFGELCSNDQFSAEDLQKNTWKTEIDILKEQLITFKDGHIILEYTIPRIGNRIDGIFIYKGIVFLLEFKVGSNTYSNHDTEQVIDYALDLNSFHKESHNKLLVPILICTEASNKDFSISLMKDNILNPLYCNKNNIANCINNVIENFTQNEFSPYDWINSIYMPTPTIIEAAQVLYHGHNVEEISRNDASAINLTRTTKAISDIIDFTKQNNKKSICFITGVPGAGKTLAGLNIAIDRQQVAEDEHAIFLSGNGPLVEVLQESLARDDSTRNNTKKAEAMRKAKEFIQIIHHFRDDAISTTLAPIEKVAIFDEAQRAWDKTNLTNFMKRKKGVFDFDMSEPEFLINIMNRHSDWSVIICLIGGGQEINTGEAGLIEWFDSLRDKFSNWNVYVSDKISDHEYTRGKSVNSLIQGLNCKIVKDLHLSVSLRSFRSENVAGFVKDVLDVNVENAKQLLTQFKNDYPIYITRNLNKAKTWIINQAKGSERYGMIASSGAKRLRSYGIWVQNKVDAPTWFLNGKDDVRSSYFLEETATEFDIQGLELDWSILCWDANLRFNNGKFEYYNFIGSKWQNINKLENVLYLKNAYRVLMTRARQGFVIFVPEGNLKDITRQPEYYDGIYNYLVSLGIDIL
ncbi:MAG: DUF2075 domain-containing protein [Fusobacterium varium]|uniref:DUF2075 domain-containing protein n=2 Tax=Fusobacteriaceae TaxID=203492 RepID=UPI0008A3524F|nr:MULTISPECIES: DUF2075 domain-containing protein [Fusobacterium]OFL85403.1 hypothetical protein HMPREF2747_00040 [Fusobacterium sp. HMSC073F01]RGJ31240.1 DUF2075 domain-containing protein [Fusobacterium varium]